MSTKLDILAIAAHPDDVELAASGTLAKHIAEGKTVGILDLTRGELGTRGTPELRDKEAAAASSILGLTARHNLDLGDGWFENNRVNKRAIIKVLRKYQPDVVLCNAITDRHIDHGRGSQLASEACFLSGLRKIETQLDGKTQEAWRPKAVYHYIQDRWIEPDFVIDITEHFETKMQAIMAYKSQFHNPDSTEPQTPISSPEFMEYLTARASHFGRIIGKRYGEGFTVEHAPGVNSFFDLF